MKDLTSLQKVGVAFLIFAVGILIGALFTIKTAVAFTIIMAIAGIIFVVAPTITK